MLPHLVHKCARAGTCPFASTKLFYNSSVLRFSAFGLCWLSIQQPYGQSRRPVRLCLQYIGHADEQTKFCFQQALNNKTAIGTWKFSSLVCICTSSLANNDNDANALIMVYDLWIRLSRKVSIQGNKGKQTKRIREENLHKSIADRQRRMPSCTVLTGSLDTAK